MNISRAVETLDRRRPLTRGERDRFARLRRAYRRVPDYSYLYAIVPSLACALIAAWAIFAAHNRMTTGWEVSAFWLFCAPLIVLFVSCASLCLEAANSFIGQFISRSSQRANAAAEQSETLERILLDGQAQTVTVEVEAADVVAVQFDKHYAPSHLIPLDDRRTLYLGAAPAPNLGVPWPCDRFTITWTRIGHRLLGIERLGKAIAPATTISIAARDDAHWRLLADELLIFDAPIEACVRNLQSARAMHGCGLRLW